MKVVSWDGNSINDGSNFVAGMHGQVQALPEVQGELAPRSDAWPLVAGVFRPGRLLFVEISVKGSPAATYRQLLHQYFDPEDETAKRLVIDDDDGTNDRYVMAVCEKLEDIGQGSGVEYLATLRVHGDVRWRSTAASTDTWAITATGDTKTLTNSGADDAYPILRIQPTSAKSSGFTKKRQLFVRWNVTAPYLGYPLDVVNHSFDGKAAIASTDMDTDGNAARIYMDGVQVDRWLDGISDSDSAIWVNTDWRGAAEGTLSAAMASTDSPTEFQLSAMSKGAFADYPTTGLLVIGSEAFSYTGRNVQQLKFTGVTRAILGTTAATHTSTDTVWWMQHDLRLLYGDLTLTAQTVDDDYKPIMTLASSTNTSWDYDEFGEDDGLRTGAWSFINVTNSGGKYTNNQFTDTNPWVELGIYNNILGYGLSYARWELYNPCGITNANFANGEKRSESNLTAWYATIQSRVAGGAWRVEDTIAAPSTDGAWEAWSDNQALTSGSTIVALQLQRAKGVPGYEDQKIEVADVTLTLDSSGTPTVTVGSEESIYPLSITLTNNTTGDSITLNFVMDLNEQLELDTDAKTIVYLKDNSNQFQALTLVGGARKDWLKLAPGSNEIEITESGLVGMTIDFEWEKRNYT